jgi:AraC-like DNA-binding protein
MPIVPQIMIYNPKLLAEQIDARLSESPRITLSQLARDLGVSRRTLEDVFRQAKGMSYRSYQQSMLLRAALNLLAKSDRLTIKQIAFLLGYSSLAAFSRFIRSKTGKNPSDLRRGSTSGFA